MTRALSREELSRTLVMYGAFTASGLIMDGDDTRTLVHLRRLRARLADERGDAVGRVIRGLESIVAKEHTSPGASSPKRHGRGRGARTRRQGAANG